MLLLALFAAFAFGQENISEDEEDLPSPYAQMGFPVTFDDEIFTEQDVARSLGTPLDEIPELTLMRQLAILLNRKLSARIAADLKIDVTDREVDGMVRQQIEDRQGEAKFYEWLAQQGTTLGRFVEERRQLILDQKLAMLFATGITPDQLNLLPARIRPTPREISIAWRHDTARSSGGVRVRRLELLLDVDRKTRNKLAAQQALTGKSKEWVQEQIELAVKTQVESVTSGLKTTSFEEVAAKRGVDVEKQGAQWLDITGDGEAEKFLTSAKAKTASKPIALPQGGYRLIYLIERERPGERRATDPEVAKVYEARIRSARASKWEAVMRIRALDRAAVRPARVRDDLREQHMATLRGAEEDLRRLGLK